MNPGLSFLAADSRHLRSLLHMQRAPEKPITDKMVRYGR